MSEGIAYGDYYLLGRLGTGGTAEVFLGKRLGDGVGGRLLAVKRLLTQFASSPDLIQTFQEESRIASLLHHPNIVETVEAGVNNAQHFHVMEFIHGKDLKTIQQRARKTGAPLPYVVSAYIAAAIADALDYAHAHEAPDDPGKTIVHRNLSPQKLLVTYEGEPKVIDFSARDAKSRGIEGRIGSIKGRFGYLSPEQAISNPADRRSDVFSLGVILYEMTTGMAPFRGGSDAATLGKVARASFSPPELVNASMPRVLGKIIERAMQREADKRYATAAEMSSALREFIREDGQVVDKGELARIMRELFFEDYEREKARVEQYRKLTPMAPTGSGSKPVAMADGDVDDSRTHAAHEEQTIADEPSLAGIDDDDDTGISNTDGAPLDDRVERTDTGITSGEPDTNVHHETAGTGASDGVPDTGVHDVSDTGVHREVTDTGYREITNTGVHSEPLISGEFLVDTRVYGNPVPLDPQTTEANGDPFALPHQLPFDPTPSPVTAAPVPEVITAPVGDFNLGLGAILPKLEEEPTGADSPVAEPVQLSNPWATSEGSVTSNFSTPVPLSEGPTLVAETLFGAPPARDAGFQLKTPTAASPSIIFESKTKVYDDSIADLVRRTQPSGFGVETSKHDYKRPKSADNAQISEVLAVVAAAPSDMNVATTVQPLPVATVVATPPEKAVTEVALAQSKGKKKKKSRAFAKLDEHDGDTAADKVDDVELLDDEAFARSGPFLDAELEAPRTVATPIPGAMLADDEEEEDAYEEVGRFFSRSDMITLVVAAFMGLLIMTASYVYALNVPLPEQATILEEQ